MKKILISTVAAAMVTSSLVAATSVTFGDNVMNSAGAAGTVQDIAAATNGKISVELKAINEDYTTAANIDGGVLYIPDIGIGKGNLITVKVHNGYVGKVTLNDLYLVDANSSDQNTTGSLQVAKMTDFVAGNSGSNSGYAEMTFKFEREVQSGHTLVLANTTDTNASLTTDDGKKIAGTENAAITLYANDALKCSDAVGISVINSTDQSGNLFSVANAPKKNGLTVISAFSLNQTKYTSGIAGAASSDKSSATSCPTWECEIALSDGEKSFTGVGVNTDACPTCATTLDPVLFCATMFQLDYTASSHTATDVGVTNIDYTLTTTNNDGITIKGYAETYNANTTLTGATASVSGLVHSIALNGSAATTTGTVAPSADNNVTSIITADGTTVLAPRAFDLSVSVDTNESTVVAIDSISNFAKLVEGGTTLGVSYLSANPDYRSFVRVTSNASAVIQAIVVTEDGATSARVDVTDTNGAAVTIGANGGAVVVEAADLLRSAQDAGFAGTGMRFNATLYVKTTGTVDAVAYQTANGSQRYLPVNGATGGTK